MDATPHPASLDRATLAEQCDFRRTTASGPGGQHRNRTASAVVATHRPTGVIGQASERRSQHQNREMAIGRLRVNLALAIRREPSLAGPSDLWRQRTPGGKLRVSSEHEDFATLLAEALDRLKSVEYDFAAFKESMQVSTSQIVKFLKIVPPAWQAVQQQRFDRGLDRLK